MGIKQVNQAAESKGLRKQQTWYCLMQTEVIKIGRGPVKMGPLPIFIPLTRFQISVKWAWLANNDKNLIL